MALKLVFDKYRPKAYVYSRLGMAILAIITIILTIALMVYVREWQHSQYESGYFEFMEGMAIAGCFITIIHAPFDLFHPKSPRWAALTTDIIAFCYNAGVGLTIFIMGAWFWKDDMFDPVLENGWTSKRDFSSYRLWFAATVFYFALFVWNGFMIIWSGIMVHRERKAVGRYNRRASQVYEMELQKQKERDVAAERELSGEVDRSDADTRV